ncbi:MAG: citryl-CoA lyase [Parvibaculaceae bacterium]
MSNFGKSPIETSICDADRTSISVRGEDLCNSLMGGLSLSGFFYFHLTGKKPEPNQVKMLDALIISIAEHGLSPAAISARMTYASAPEAVQGAVAAGVLGVGSVVLGATDEAAKVLVRAIQACEAGQAAKAVAFEIATEHHSKGEKLPGFGHPLHKPTDPRSDRLIQLARDYGVSGPHTKFLTELSAAADEVWGKPLVVNVQAPIASIALDMGLPDILTKAIPIIARAIGVLGHIAEEIERPIGFSATMAVNKAAKYVPPQS